MTRNDKKLATQNFVSAVSVQASGCHENTDREDKREDTEKSVNLKPDPELELELLLAQMLLPRPCQ